MKSFTFLVLMTAISLALITAQPVKREGPPEGDEVIADDKYFIRDYLKYIHSKLFYDDDPSRFLQNLFK
ncbi:unnamed protein product [Bursaphelenchus xylophilus]|uniref:(pine wood nematode) hypothetical protein n=1 Tax=Bursaphelenchus xylophilus TaxID=6326 RepID=A0A1I7RV05_BURXY|nr:unnamed protein product [Bursaphelenchus xylophilus]CAG9105239.1 unnamed protein product [Bursaphelenchus xylophilus]